MIKIATFQYPVFEPYDTSTIEIYFSGCTRNCKHCHNPELQSFNAGKPTTAKELITFLKEREDLFNNISFTGGDLLCQDKKEAETFTLEIYNEFKIAKIFWLFTGESNLKNVPKWCLKVFDFIKIGVYNHLLKQEGFPASSNQKLLKKGVDY